MPAVRRPLGERPDAKSSPAEVRLGSLFLPKRATRSYGAAQTSCGSSRSRYWRLPPVRTTGSPTPWANFSAAASVSVEPLALTTVALSWFDEVPIVTLSPAANPVLTELMLVAPVAVVVAVLEVSAPGENAWTATTVQ